MTGLSESVAKSLDPEIDEKRRAAAEAAWGGGAPADPPEDSGKQAAMDGASHGGSNPAKEPGSLAGLSVEELEAELARRRSTAL